MSASALTAGLRELALNHVPRARVQLLSPLLYGPKVDTALGFYWRMMRSRQVAGVPRKGSRPLRRTSSACDRW